MHMIQGLVVHLRLLRIQGQRYPFIDIGLQRIRRLTRGRLNKDFTAFTDKSIVSGRFQCS